MFSLRWETKSKTPSIAFHSTTEGGIVIENEKSDSEAETALDVYWKANIVLITVLLAIWFIVSYGFGIFFVEQMNYWTIGSLPLGFWFAHQGSIIVFVLLILLYAWGMDYLRDQYHHTEEINNES